MIRYRFHKAKRVGYRMYAMNGIPTKYWPENKKQIAINTLLRNKHSDLYEDVLDDEGNIISAKHAVIKTDPATFEETVVFE